jgi:alpha-L-rhamnosidase
MAMWVARIGVADPVHLLCNHLANPLGIDLTKPRLSWQDDSTARNWHQSAYQILVSTSAQSLKQGKGEVWDSGKVKGAQSVGIAYSGKPLQSRGHYFWTVKVWDADDHASPFVPAAWWEMGLLSPTDWQAKWITRNNPQDAPDRAAMHWLSLPGKPVQDLPPHMMAVFRKQFQLASLPKNAALFVIAHGDFVVSVNGHEVTSKADWSDFDRKDVTSELVIGNNAIELRLSSLEVSPFAPPAKYHPTVVAALLKLTNPDGSLSRIASDASWQSHAADNEAWGVTSIAGDLNDETLNPPGPLPQPAALFRHVFKATHKVASARLYITALGSYRVTINGQSADGSLLTPDFTDYRKRVDYQSYDVTRLVKHGENAIGIVLGDGWYASPLTWAGTHLYPPPNRVAAQLELHYTDGSSGTVTTDGDWRTSASPIALSQIYAGEDYDARNRQPGWDLVKFHAEDWAQAVVGEAPSAKLTGLTTSAVHINSEVKPVSVKPSAGGAYVFDFGQNMVGWAELKVRGAAGTRVRLRFAEILNPDGTIYRKNLRNADATDTYTLSGGGDESYSPSFTFHGFRYVEVSGFPGTPTLDALTGKVVGSLEEPFSGQLKTSSELVNKMWSIGVWGQRGNFLSIPTDCPQRDERLGWMGDAGVFWRTGAYNFDISAFTRKFMLDVNDAQTTQGDFANVSPDLLFAERHGSEGAPGWSDAGVILPYTAWLQYGDTSYIDDNWDAMQRFMGYIANDNPDFIRKNGNGPNFADWLAPDPHSPNELVATAYWALSARMMMQMAQATGHAQEAGQYAELIQNIRAAYGKAFVKDDGEVAGGTQTAYLLTLYAKLAPESLQPVMVDHLVADIESRGGHLSTGFLGTPFLLFALSEHGRSDIAYKLLLNETYPSWGYMLSKGATTWWERWNGDTGDPAMNSFNHYAFGSVMAWVYRSVAGIDTAPDGPGFQHIEIQPRAGSGLDQARGEYDSAYGKIVTDWKQLGGVFTLKVQIPANTTATVQLPAKSGDLMTQDGKAMPTPVAEIGSGSFVFEVHARPQ